MDWPRVPSPITLYAMRQTCNKLRGNSSVQSPDCFPSKGGASNLYSRSFYTRSQVLEGSNPLGAGALGRSLGNDRRPIVLLHKLGPIPIDSHSSLW